LVVEALEIDGAKFSDTILEDEVMNIEIHDAALEARIQKLLQATGSSSVEEVCSIWWRLRKNRIAGFWKTELRLTQKLELVSINSTAVKEFRKINWMLI
jgi:hypothetical protein